MAKKSRIVRNNRVKKLVSQHAATRAKLKKVIRSLKATEEEKDVARVKLAKLPRSSSKVRIRNRCLLTGRSRGVYRKFGLGRSKLREKALSGELPGMTKASW